MSTWDSGSLAVKHLVSPEFSIVVEVVGLGLSLGGVTWATCSLVVVEDSNVNTSIFSKGFLGLSVVVVYGILFLTHTWFF